MGGKIVEIKFSEEELLKIAESGLAEMSCEQIKQLIQKESQKNYEDINTDFIDLCFNVLSMKQNNEPFKIENLKKRSNKTSIRKAVLFAAVFMVFIVTTLTVTANVFRFNIPKEIAALIKGDVEIDYNLEYADTTADGYTLLDTDFAKQLADYGISPVTFPEEMIKENCRITKIESMLADEISNIVRIDFYYNGQQGWLDIEQMSKGAKTEGRSVVTDIKSGQIININGMDVLVFEQEGNCIIKYKDNRTTYDISLYCDLETAIKFVESIK